MKPDRGKSVVARRRGGGTVADDPVQRLVRFDDANTASQSMVNFQSAKSPARNPQSRGNGEPGFEVLKLMLLNGRLDGPSGDLQQRPFLLVQQRHFIHPQKI